MKGTRTQPQCGFSYKVLSILNDSKVPFEVVSHSQQLSLAAAPIASTEQCWTGLGPAVEEPACCR